MNFQITKEMPYANNSQTEAKLSILYKNLKAYLKSINPDESLFFKVNEVVYIPDLHGDFVHLIVTLHRHGLLESEVLEPRFQLRKDFQYVFLGDFYDRAPDADVIDYWLNRQITRGLKIYRLLGNHEFAFLIRKENGHPVIFPSQDSIKDMSNDFQITESLLKNIAEGNLLAAYVPHLPVLYIHSYAINNDFPHLGLDQNTDITTFAIKLNERLKQHGQKSYERFLHCKKIKNYSWEEIIKPFLDDPLFNIYTKKEDINTSLLWRRTGEPTLNTFPAELDAPIPDNVYQIVGHTPVFSFNLPSSQSVTEPFTMTAKSGAGKIQFSDVGIGYYYKSNSFERPEVSIKGLH